MTQTHIKPVSVAINETECWELPEKYKGKVTMYGIYVYDANQVTYCAEVTPSYWLRFVSNEFSVKPSIVAAAERMGQDPYEEFHDWLEEQIADDASCYMHCRSVEQIKVRRGFDEVEIDYGWHGGDEDAAYSDAWDDAWEAVRDSYWFGGES